MSACVCGGVFLIVTNIFQCKFGQHSYIPNNAITRSAAVRYDRHVHYNFSVFIRNDLCYRLLMFILLKNGCHHCPKYFTDLAFGAAGPSYL